MTFSTLGRRQRVSDDRHNMPKPELREIVASIRRFPSAVLLATQLLILVFGPFLDTRERRRTGAGIAGILVLGLTIRLVQRTPFRTAIGVALGLPAIVLLAIEPFTDIPGLVAWVSVLQSLLYFYAAASLISYLVASRRATADELFAAAGTFTLLAWGFAYLFMFLQELQPQSFGAALNPELPRTWTELMFLSFALLSSTGIGDIIPLKPLARSLSSLEMFVGVVYLASVVSRLMGLTLPSKVD